MQLADPSTRSPTVRPGGTPFKMKGVAYRGAIRHIDQEVEGGLAAVIHELSTIELRRFFHAAFMAATWYDAMPLVDLATAAARLARRPLATFAHEIARAQAEDDTRGVYKLLLKFTSPTQVMHKMPRIAARYFDFCTLETSEVRPNTFETCWSGIPAPLIPILTACAEGYTEYLIDATGGKNLEMRPRSELERMKGGVELRRIKMTVSWS